MSAHMIIEGDAALESIRIKAAESHVEKKYAEAPLEITLYKYRRHHGFFISPADTAASAKTYYVAKGLCLHVESGKTLRPGDTLVIRHTSGINQILMIEDTELLVQAWGQENFSVISDNSRKLDHILDAIQDKDHYTKNHCSRVFHLSLRLALKRGYSGKRFFILARAARLHDIGKIYIPDHVLKKEEVLDSQEMQIIKEHVALGRSIIQENFSDEIFSIVVQHHERMDGSGYPAGLRGGAISEGGRILAICDSFDAMTTNRVYRAAKSVPEALDELRRCAGSLYDPEMVEQFITLIQENENNWLEVLQ